MPATASDYYAGALRSLEDARTLYDHNRWVGCVYLAGRSVQALFRALLRLKSRHLVAGHDLRELHKQLQIGGVFMPAEESLEHRLNEVVVVWHNNLRFVGNEEFKRSLRKMKRHRRIGSRRVLGDPVKANAESILQACESLFARGAQVWRHWTRE